jgi:hypothetical protein
MLSRIKEQTDKKDKKNKQVSRFIISLSIVFILATVSLSMMIYMKYRTTQNWTSSKLNSNMASIPPEFAKNTYTVEMANDIKKLNDVNKSLDAIKRDNGLTDKTIDTAKIAKNESQSILKKYNITTGEAITNQNTLKMYIDIFNIEQNAYETPEAKQLEQMIAMLNKKQIEKETETDSIILKRLNVIASDYQKLNTFTDTYVPQLGEIKNGVVTVKTDITEDLTNQIITSIENDRLDKFSNIKKLKTIISSTKWNKIINSNKQLSKKQKWDKIYAAFNALSQTQYVDISKIKTLQDAENLGLKIKGNKDRTGYEILKTSPVTHIQANGETVFSGQYVRKDIVIIATIDPTYKPIPSQSDSSSSSTTETNDSERESSTEQRDTPHDTPHDTPDDATRDTTHDTSDTSGSKTTDSSTSTSSSENQSTKTSSDESIVLPPSTTQQP